MSQVTECFNIRLYQTSSLQLNMNMAAFTPVKDIQCEKHNYSKMPIRIVADPFLFVHNDRVYLFYEQQRLYHPGVIMMTSSKDMIDWTNPVMALEEKCHLSFPFVFQENQEIYMIPETSELGEIRLYKADDDSLENFVYVRSIGIPSEDTDNLNFTDTCIFKDSTTYYLFTSTENKGNYQQHLFYAEKLEGPYLKHPGSPSAQNNKVGRNGGSILRIDNKLIRVTQDCVMGYGENIHLLQIDELTREQYSEHIILENMFSRNYGFYLKGGHQFNAVNYNGKTIIATDAKEYHRYFVERILHKIGVLK